MSIFNFKAHKPFLWVAGCLAAAVVQAETMDVNRLGMDLTPMGSIRAGNESGTIPEWTGGMAAGAAPIEANGHYHNPFADEKPLYVITAQNYQQYSDVLSEGQIARFKTYPSFRMPVYRTHRSTALPEAYYQKTRENQGVVTLENNGHTLANYEYGIPFALPTQPLEVIWNHLTRYRGGSIDREFATATVASNGTTAVVTYHQWLAWREVFADLPAGDDRLYNTLVRVLTPARLAGLVTLVQDSMDTSSNPRAAWQYNPGQRRVRRAPTLSYDTSARYSSGIVTSDGVDGYGGAPDRYDWTLVGQQELLIGYNAYDLADKTVTYQQMLTPNHLNPDMTRYEQHRVWVVEAELKNGSRHMYQARRFYVDADSWQIMASDIYDGRNTLWRLYESHLKQMHDIDTPITAIEVTHDLLSGQYATNFMINESKTRAVFGKPASISDYSTTALRQAGR